MKIFVCGQAEQYDVAFQKQADGRMRLCDPCEDLLASAACLTELPVCELIVPADIDAAMHYLIAHADPNIVDDTYGENEAYIEVTYSEDERQNLLRMFDAK